METFLSEEVACVIKTSGEENKVRPKSINYITDELVFNWNNVETIFCDCHDDLIIHEQTPEWFQNKQTCVHALMCEATEIMHTVSKEELSSLWEKCTWTNRTEDIVTCYKYLKQNDEINLLEALLILTTILERSLGDIYLIQNKNVPFLLKDLLETKYLYSLLGEAPIRLLQILVGTSKSLNLRNIAWHGFLSSGELKRNHVSVFFIVFGSIGNILFSKDLSSKNIPYKNEVANFNQNISKMLSHNTFIDLLKHSNEIRSILQSTPFIGSTHLKYWERLLQYALERNNAGCIILLLPQFEHLLRRIYCKINNCPERCVTAEMKELYITLDEIFAANISNSSSESNKLFEIVTLQAIELYEDLFSHLSGPRIRDKISHGEKYFNEIPSKVIQILLNLATYIIIKAHLHLGISYDVKNYTVITDLYSNTTNYTSVFHPNAILKYNILETYDDVKELLSLPKPDDIECNFHDSDILNCFKSLENNCLKFTKIVSKDQKDFKSYVNEINIPTLFRPKFEQKCVKRMTKIISVLSDISIQILKDATARFTLHKEHTLSSRQRERYPEILETTVLIHSALNTILHIMVFIMHHLFQITEENQSQDTQLFRFLLYNRKYEDKILMLVDVRKNNWQKAKELTYNYRNEALRFLRRYNCL